MANTNEQMPDPEFPGYPHYPSKDDIMNKANNERVDIDVENISSLKNTPAASTIVPAMPAEDIVDDLLSADGNDELINSEQPGDADITPDELIALGDEDTNFEPAVNSINTDLDIPGAEDDDAEEEIGAEDEENNYYSIGGDDHENLEEDKEN